MHTVKKSTGYGQLKWGVIITLAYFGAAYLGLNWATVKGAGSPVWPAAGVGYAGLMLGGASLWPAIFIGRLAAAIVSGSSQPLWADFLIAAANAAATFIPVVILNRFPIDLTFKRLNSMLRYIALCGGLGAIIAAVVGTAVLTISSGLDASGAWAVFVNWSVGSFTGAVIVGPLITSWWLGDFRNPPGKLFLILILTAVASWIQFLLPDTSLFRTWHMLPLLIWAALAYQVRGASAAILILAAFVVAGASAGHLAFGDDAMPTATRMSLLQQFLAITAVTILLLASIDEERFVSGNEKLQTALDAADQGTFETNILTATTRFDLRAKQLTGLERAVDDVGNFDLLRIAHPDDRLALKQEIRQSLNPKGNRKLSAEFRVRNRSSHILWLSLRGAVDFDGLPPFTRPVAIHGTIRDITDRKTAEAARERLSSIIEHSPDFIGITGVDGKTTFINPGGRKMVGIPDDEDITNMRIEDFHPPHIAELIIRQAIPHAMQNGVWEGETEILHRDGTTIAILQSIIAHRNESGTVEYLSTNARDITTRKKAAAHQNMLLRELSHRVKNMMAVVQSISRRTAAATSDPAEFAKTFEGRISSLAASHALLTDTDWNKVSLRDLLKTQLDPVASIGNTSQFTLNGPVVLLTPEQATNIGLAIHELATNASKYGALSQKDGHIEIVWSMTDTGVCLVWREINSALDIKAPTRRGFGQVMIDSIFPEIVRDYQTRGLVMTIPIKLLA